MLHGPCSVKFLDIEFAWPQRPVIALRMIDLIGQESFVDGALSPVLCRQ